MYYPYLWNAKNTPPLTVSPVKYEFIDPPIPKEHCQEEAPANPSGCRFGGLGKEYVNFRKSFRNKNAGGCCS